MTEARHAPYRWLGRAPRLRARPRHRAEVTRPGWQRPGQAAVLLLSSVGMLTAGAGALQPGVAGQPAVPVGAAPAAAPPAPAPPPQPDPLQDAPTGELVAVPGAGPAAGTRPLTGYRVEVEAGLVVDAAGFASEVQQTLGDASGWTSTKGITMQRTDGPAAFTITLASAATTDRLCAPLSTDGTYSCSNGGKAVINVERWRGGAPTYSTDLASYRQYLINHEVGHALGRRHIRCPAPGAPAPVMVQQSISLGGCTPNPWPQVTSG